MLPLGLAAIELDCHNSNVSATLTSVLSLTDVLSVRQVNPWLRTMLAFNLKEI